MILKGVMILGGRVKVGTNDLGTRCPELALEWHKSKNGDMTPKDVCVKSLKKVWWQKVVRKAEKEYILEWEATIANRVGGAGCPYLSNPPRKVLTGFNDFASNNLELCKKWNYVKNENITPDKIYENTNTKYWWIHKVVRDDKEFIHEWKTTPTVIKKSKGADGCPICRGMEVQVGFNDLYTNRHEIAEEWDYERNAPLAPQDVTCGSNRKVYWNCKWCGHNWKAVINNRANHYTKCPKCTARMQTSFSEQAIYYYLKKTFSDCINRDINTIGKEIDVYVPRKKFAIEYCGLYWHSSKQKKKADMEKQKLCNKQGITLVLINESKNKNEYIADKHIINCIPRSDYSHLKFVFECINKELIDLKILDAPIQIDLEKDIVTIREQYQQIKPENNIEVTHPELIKEWDYENNGNLKPSMFTKGSTANIFWKHTKDTYQHRWKAKICERTQGQNCPICAGKRIQEGYNDLYSRNLEFVKEWDYEKNKISPREVTFCSKKKVWWKHIVEKDGKKFIHSWEAQVYSRKSGQGCPICAGKIIQKNFNDFATVCPELLNEWDYERNTINPEEISYGYDKKVYWIHKIMRGGKEFIHSWEASPNSRTNMKSGCPYCTNKKVLSGDNDLKSSVPEIAEKWDYDRNYPLSPEHVTVSSSKKVYWLDRKQPRRISDRTKYIFKQRQ